MVDIADQLLTDTRREPGVTDEQYHDQLSDFVAQLNAAFSTRSVRVIEDSDLLRVLHPAVNTLGYIYLLNHLAIDRTSDIFIISLNAFLTQFDPAQARYAGPQWRHILDMTAEVLHATHNLDLLIPYRAAIIRMDPTSGTLTTNHLQYIELCLQAQRPREALPILDRDWVNVPYDEVDRVDKIWPCEELQTYITNESGISADVTILVVQEYYLLGAQVYIGLRNYDRASLFLELVLSTPGANHPVNSFMVEAYKKLVLVNLIWRGQTPSLSQIIEAPVVRTLSQVCKIYEVLSDAFKKRDIARFDAEVDNAAGFLADEGNQGLAAETAGALRRWRILDLQKHYAAMPVHLVADHLGISAQSTLPLLQAMIQDGYLRASVSSSNSTLPAQNGSSAADTSIVRFHSWDTSKASLGADEKAEDKLKAQVRRIETLSKAVKEADRRFSLTREYGDWLRRNKRAGDAGAAAYEDPMEMDAGPDGRTGVLDEDIMAS